MEITTQDIFSSEAEEFVKLFIECWEGNLVEVEGARLDITGKEDGDMEVAINAPDGAWWFVREYHDFPGDAVLACVKYLNRHGCNLPHKIAMGPGSWHENIKANWSKWYPNDDSYEYMGE